MFDDLYENIGGKIKSWAKWMFIVEAIGAIIFGIFILDKLGFDDGWWGFLVFSFGPIIAWVSSWLLYAFGELVEDVHAIRKKYYPQAEKSKYDATEASEYKDEENATHEDKDCYSDIPYMDKPIDYIHNNNWEKGIKKLSYEKLWSRYIDKGNYSDTPSPSAV